MIDDIFKRVDSLTYDAVPDAWILSPTPNLTMGDLRALVGEVRVQRLMLNDKRRAELIEMVAAAARPIYGTPREIVARAQALLEEVTAAQFPVDKL